MLAFDQNLESAIDDKHLTMTTPQAQRQIETLRSIADAYLVDKEMVLPPQREYQTPHDAKSITDLVQSSCLAVLTPSSPNVGQFINVCNHGLAHDVTGAPLERANAVAILNECFSYVDELFFFGLLTRQIHPDIDQQKTRRLTVLEFPLKPRRDYAGAYQASNGVIRIYLRGSSNEGVRRFSDLLFTVIHEACHAYLQILADSKHLEHKKWVTVHRRHGEMFQVLFRFVMQCIVELVPSELLRGAMNKSLKALEYQIARKSSRWEALLVAFTVLCCE